MKEPFLEIGAENFSINAFEIKPLAGYEKPINKETKKELPFCCEFHEGVHKNITDDYERFPNCCEWHKPLNDVDWFDKEDFKYIINKVVNQISYTEHCIQECINGVDWYSAITEYIDFNILSFGQLRGGYGSPVGLSVFTFQLKHYITNTDLDISKSKRKALINFFEVSEQKETDITNTTDLNVLHVTYQKWLKVFPFDISFFANLKEHFENQLPILDGKPEINRYSKIAKVRLHTKDSLIDVLLKTTNDIIKQINPYTLYEQGLLTEPQKIKMELVLNEMRIDNERGYSSQKQNEEQQYRDILKKWFSRQKQFINELKELINTDSDNDFISGRIKLRFVPQAESGFYEVLKGDDKRKYTLEQYFDLFLQNAEYCIDELLLKDEKLQAINNAIFDLQKDQYDNSHPEILRLIQKNIKHLENIKTYIENTNEKALPPRPIDVNQNRTKKVISETFENMDKKGWEYAFISEQDYNIFSDLLTNFFEYNPYTLPETTIRLKRTCKTKIAKALGEIHKELSNENKLSNDTEYFKIIRVLSHFEKEKKGDLYKALTR